METPVASLQFSCSTETSAVDCFAEVKGFKVMANVVAPNYEPSDEKRAPLNLVAVIDKSGSMSGDKIALVKKSVQFVQQQMQARDRFSVVTFADNATVDVSLTRMDRKGKEAAALQVQKIRADGSTNLSGGLFAALDEIRRVEATIDPQQVTSVLLLTDGQANRGISNTDELVAEFKKRLALHETAVSVYCLGFGSDHNESLLRAVSEANTGGVYYFLPGEEQIADSFASCLGGLLSVVAQNIKLTITPLVPTTRVARLIGTAHRGTERPLPDGTTAFEVVLGDLRSEEIRNILFETEFQPTMEPISDWGVVRLTLSYMNVIAGLPETLESRAAIDRPRHVSPEQAAPNVELDEQVNRLTTVDAIERARAAANAGNFDDAKRAVEDARHKLHAAVSAKSPKSVQLVGELDELDADLRNTHNFKAGASKKWASKGHGHSMQRASSIESPYANAVQSAVMQKSKSSDPK